MTQAATAPQTGAAATLRDVVQVMDELYPPALAASWDAVGLVCGDPEQPVRKVLAAVDPVAAVVDEAVAGGCDLLITHHPLFLRGTTSVAATTAKGKLVHRLIRAGVALFTAHTNADHARPGVSDALAHALGLTDLRPIDSLPTAPRDKLVTFVPADVVDPLLDALAAAGAGTIGAYDRCAWTTEGVGTFLPRPGATPVIGEVGKVETVPEVRVEMVLPRERRAAVIAALHAVHPYEEPAYDLYELAAPTSPWGTGRIGVLPEPEPLQAFLDRVRCGLPATGAPWRYAGDPQRAVRTVAVCGGAGDAYLAAVARSGADVYLTADLRHHPASEHLAEGGCALIDVPHWASEWPWLPDLAARLGAALTERGTTVRIDVSGIVTDPWTGSLQGGTP